MIDQYKKAKRKSCGQFEHVPRGREMVLFDARWHDLLSLSKAKRSYKCSVYVSDPKIFHKSRIPKVMFLYEKACPHPEHTFDGRIGVWPFTLQRTVKRSD
eukprot:scpid89237/ scgid28882/ 